jgi:HK97 family phage major capsid protein
MQEYLKNLRDARHQAWSEAKQLLDTAQTEKREFNAEEQAKWDRINADIDAKDEQIRTFIAVEEREREASEARAAYEPIVTEAASRRRDEQAVDSLTKFLRGEVRSLDLDFRGVAREKRLIRAGASAHDLRAEFRDMGEDVTTAGGYLVPTGFMRSLYDFLEWYTGARQLNVTVMTTTSGEPMQFPNVTAHGTAALRGEGTAIPEADAALGQVTLNAWKYGVLTQVSNELLADSGVDILGFVAEDTARAIARVTDTDYVTGSGSSKPKGIISTQPVGATAQTGSTGIPSVGNIIDLVYSVNPIARQGAQFFTLDTNVAKIRKILDTDGRPVWQPSVEVGSPDNLLGYPIVEDPNVAAFGTAGGTAIAFGNFRGYYIRDVGSLRFERSDEFAFSSDLVTFRTVLRTDGDWVSGASGECKFLKMPTT